MAGREGQLARALRERSSSAVTIHALGRPELDVTDRLSVARAVLQFPPDVIVNAAAFTTVDQAESDQAAAFAVNRDGARNVALAAAESGVPLIHVSTDYVFGGDKAEPYVETDMAGPINVYGASKLAGEQAVAAAWEGPVIVRSAWLHAPFGRNFVRTMLRLAAQREVIDVVADQRGSPTFAPDLAAVILQIAARIVAEPAASDWRGIFHAVNAGEASWAELAEWVFACSRARGGPYARVRPILAEDFVAAAARPRSSRLDTDKLRQAFGIELRPWQEAVEESVSLILHADKTGAP